MIQILICIPNKAKNLKLTCSHTIALFMPGMFTCQNWHIWKPFSSYQLRHIFVNLFGRNSTPELPFLHANATTKLAETALLDPCSTLHQHTRSRIATWWRQQRKRLAIFKALFATCTYTVTVATCGWHPGECIGSFPGFLYLQFLIANSRKHLNERTVCRIKAMYAAIVIAHSE